MNENCPPNRSLKKKFKINKGIRCLKSWFDTNAWRFLISLSKISSWRGDVSRSSDADCVVGEVDISDVIASTVCVMELERCRGEVSTASNPSSLFACANPVSSGFPIFALLTSFPAEGELWVFSARGADGGGSKVPPSMLPPSSRANCRSELQEEEYIYFYFSKRPAYFRFYTWWWFKFTCPHP